jgi:NADPH2:quinone reductase
VFKWWASIIAVWLWDKVSPRRKVLEDFDAMVELLREGKIHPVVAERLPLAEARHAHELLESSASKGKLVLVP